MLITPFVIAAMTSMAGLAVLTATYVATRKPKPALATISARKN